MTNVIDDQPTFWQDRVLLDEDFYRALSEHPVPLSEAALRAIGPRSLVIDVYIWLAYRLHALKKNAEITWPALYAQFGAGVARLRDFRRYFIECLTIAAAAYPDARVSIGDHGIIIRPSRPPILKLTLRNLEFIRAIYCASASQNRRARVPHARCSARDDAEHGDPLVERGYRRDTEPDGNADRSGQGLDRAPCHSVRRVNGIHAYRSAEKNGEWLTMSEAAATLGVTNHRVRRLISDSILSAEQVVPGAPIKSGLPTCKTNG